VLEISADRGHEPRDRAGRQALRQQVADELLEVVAAEVGDGRAACLGKRRQARQIPGVALDGVAGQAPFDADVGQVVVESGVGTGLARFDRGSDATVN
jgi:hypothetical protein